MQSGLVAASIITFVFNEEKNLDLFTFKVRMKSFIFCIKDKMAKKWYCAESYFALNKNEQKKDLSCFS